MYYPLVQKIMKIHIKVSWRKYVVILILIYG